MMPAVTMVLVVPMMPMVSMVPEMPMVPMVLVMPMVPVVRWCRQCHKINIYLRIQFDRVNLTTKFVTSGGCILFFFKSNLVLIL